MLLLSAELMCDATYSQFTPEKHAAASAGPSKVKGIDFGSRETTSKKRPADIDCSIINRDEDENTAGDPLAEFYAQAISDKDAEVPQCYILL